jgi:hypothetical protein
MRKRKADPNNKKSGSDDTMVTMKMLRPEERTTKMGNKKNIAR